MAEAPLEAHEASEAATPLPSTLHVTVVRANALVDSDHGWFDGDSDPKVQLSILADGSRYGDAQTTEVANKGEWNVRLHLPLPQVSDVQLRAEVLDHDENDEDDPLGFVLLPLTSFVDIQSN